MSNRDPWWEYNRTVQTLGVAFAYALTGHLGLLFATPPGYATPIWPASGIALGAFLLFGARIWPGVFLGSFLVHVWIGFDPSSFANLLVPLGIGLGATLQAALGAFLIRRFAGFPNALASEGEILRFYLWAAMSCSISTAIGTTALLIAHVIPASGFLINAGTWWIGDVMGVLIVTPLVLTWLARPREYWRNRQAMITVSLTASLLVSVLMVAFGAKWERERLVLKFDRYATDLASALNKNLAGYMGVLRSLQSYYVASQKIERREFQAFVAQSLIDYPAIRALSWNPLIPDPERERFEREIRQEGFPTFKITEQDDDGNFIPAARRPHYAAIQFIEPLAINENVLGYDASSDPVRRKALEQARDLGHPAVTGPTTLIQETGDQVGVVVFLPVYRYGLPNHTAADRRDYLAGYMAAVLHIEEMMHGFMADKKDDGIMHRLIDPSASSGNQILFRCQESIDTRLPMALESGFSRSQPLLHKTVAVPFGGRQWDLEITATQEYLAGNRVAHTWLTLTVGLLLTSAIGAFALLISGRNLQLRRLVAERTRERDRTRNHMELVLGSAGDGICGMDRDGNTTFANPAALRIIGLSESELVGRRQHDILHHSREDGTPYPADECPVHATLDDGEIRHVEDDVFWRTDGSSFPVEYTCTPIKAGDDVTGAVVVFRDIADRKRAEKALAASNKELQSFAYALSHDLKEPLRMISSYLGLINKRLGREKQQEVSEFMGYAVDGAQRMSRMISDLVHYSRVDSEAADLIVVSMPKVLQQALGNLSVAIDEKAARIDLPPDLPDVLGDHSQLVRVFQNLIGNGLKYHHPERAPVIEISVARDNGQWTWAVRDNGIGIDPEHFERIFGVFQRLHGQGQYEGMGIGLAVVKRIIERHGGHIWVQSEPDKGSTFLFTLPPVDS
ncbi:CHASE domain-containing protein [Magnetospira sp. QH-2]|uniref:CHASE domain-containing protein n=1 Tax=Magnetospira sp. (strain QH-2) TaxID=1288970 RepID=UPI000697D66E|nr:CHASE domain-containing protein [Magnetospira sp. QH-2]